MSNKWYGSGEKTYETFIKMHCEGMNYLTITLVL